MKVEFVSYDGKYPNLCSGKLVLKVDDKEFVFENSLSSGGDIEFDMDWNEYVSTGPWTLIRFPDDFPKELRSEAIDIVNQNIPHGCCGGCI